jgi:hypothetical protein
MVLHATCIELKFNSKIQFNNCIKIQLKKNGMQICGEVIKILLMNMVLEKEKL